MTPSRTPQAAIAAAASLLLAASADASEVVDVRPLTDRVIVVHFDDGRVDHHGLGEPRAKATVHVDPLDVDAASKPASYTVNGNAPADVGRKSKGTDFAWFADRWENGRAVNDRPDHAKEHWVYLFLDEPMETGQTYTVETGDLATNGSAWPVTFDERATRSEAVHVNTVGYVPSAPAKFAYVYHWAGDRGTIDLKRYDGNAFHVIDAKTGEVAHTGEVAFRRAADNPETLHVTDSPPHGNFLKADVYECDFSDFATPGEYVVSVEGVGASFPFEVGDDVYREPFVAVARGLYHNRSGIALEKPYTEFTRPAPHDPAVTPGFEGKLLYTSVRFADFDPNSRENGTRQQLEAGIKGPIETAGWYQDAGDWDSYYTHLRVATELLFAYELAPRNFSDGGLNIPESGNGVPDVVDEAAWLPRFCYRLRHELMDRGYGTGGLGLRVAGDSFGSDEKVLPDGTRVGQGSWQDVDRIYTASGEDPWSTYRYAGAAAHLAHALRVAGVDDPEGVDWAREAREAYDWARANTRPGDEQKPDVPLAPHRAYAAASLFRLTGEKAYEQQFAADVADVTPTTHLMHDASFGPMAYALGSDAAEPDEALHGKIRAAVLHSADELTSSADRRALRWAGIWSFPMLVGHQTTPWVIEVAVAHGLTKDRDPEAAERYLAALYTTADYFLGTNALNLAWATGVGDRSPTHVFHMDAWYGGRGDATYQPGLIPYGPWRKQTDKPIGPWDQGWPHYTVYPAIDEWPGNERWFDNRNSPMNSEFTVHQNNGPAAALYGLLCAPGPSADDDD